MNAQTLGNIKTYCVRKYSASRGRRHDVEHVQRVRNNAFAILKALDVGSVDKDMLEALCYLHDIPMCEASRGTILSHAFVHVFEKSIIKKRIFSLIEQFRLTVEEKKILMTAMINHPYSIPYRCLNKQSDMYSKILQDADSLDYVSPIREHQFKEAHPTLSWAAGMYLSFIRTHIGWFLNYPELLHSGRMY